MIKHGRGRFVTSSTGGLARGESEGGRRSRCVCRSWDCRERRGAGLNQRAGSQRSGRQVSARARWHHGTHLGNRAYDRWGMSVGRECMHDV